EIFTGKEPFQNIENVQAIPILVARDRKTPERPDFLLPGSKTCDLFWTALIGCWVFEPDKRLTASEVEVLIKRDGTCSQIDS
ncbi:hypothetical protein FRC07_005161, partial [Ceratobasidium sp. 392]